MGEIIQINGSKGVRIDKLCVDTFSKKLSVTMAKITPYIGLKNNIEKHHVEDIKKMLQTRFKHLSLERIQNIFENERYLYYGEPIQHYQEFNSEYIARVIVRAESFDRKNRKTSNKKIETMSEDEKQQIVERGLIFQFALCKAGKKIPDHRLWIAEYLVKNGVFTDQEKQIAWRQAKDLFAEYDWQDKRTKVLAKVNYQKKLIEFGFSKFSNVESLLEKLKSK